MPSPVAHGLAGALIGWSVAPPPATDGPGALRRVILFAAAGMAADLDLLVGAHSGPSHGLGAAVIAGVVLWVGLRSYGMHGSGRLAIAISRRYWLPEFWTYNLRALGRELLILVPLALIAVALRRRPPAANAA